MLNLNVQLNTHTDFDTYLETRDSNPHYLDPKSNALPIKLASRLNLPYNEVDASYPLDLLRCRLHA